MNTTMTTKIKQGLLATLIAGSIGVAGLSYASPDGAGYGNGHHQCKKGGMKHKSPEQRLEKMATHLGLSETQKQQVQSLMANNKTTMKPLRDQKRALKRSLHTLSPSAPDYLAQINNIAEQKATLVRQMTVAKGQHRQQLFALLTPEQQQKMQAMKAARMQKHMERRGQ